MKEFKTEYWKKIIQNKSSKENVEMPIVGRPERVNSKNFKYGVKNDKNELFYENHRKLSSSLKNHRSLNKVRS